MKRVIFTTLGAIIIFAIFLYFRLGMYKTVDLSEKELGPFQTLYVEHTGPYYKISEKIDHVESWAHSHNVSCKKTFGEYIDDPKQTDEDRLRSHGGCIVDQAWPKDLKLESGMKEGEIVKRKYLVAEFSGAPSVGPYAVYPKAFAWIKENSKTLDGSIIEIYTILSPKAVETEYLFPIK